MWKLRLNTPLHLPVKQTPSGQIIHLNWPPCNDSWHIYDKNGHASYQRFRKAVAIIINCFITISPQGTVSFVSDAWGEHASDKNIAVKSGNLKAVTRRCRTCWQGLIVRTVQAKLHIPKVIASSLEVEEIRSIANVRIHVERVIGLVR